MNPKGLLALKRAHKDKSTCLFCKAHLQRYGRKKRLICQSRKCKSAYHAAWIHDHPGYRVMYG